MDTYTRRHIPGSAVIAAALGATVILAVAAAVGQASTQAPGPGRPGGRGPGGLSGMALFMALDRDGTPGLSDAEMSNAPAVLKALDKNGDGALTPDELPAFGRGGRGDESRGRGGRGDEPGETQPTSADDLATTLMAFDRNNDGKLTRAEVPERFQGLFDRADSNKDGQLTPEELKQSAASQPPSSQRGGRDEGEGGPRGREGRRGGGPFGGPDPLVSAIDLDRDGRLSSDELATLPTALRRFDRNGDGVVALDEISAGFGRGRG
ncbi:MAG: hypothetical protein ABI634_13945 [Acidobacteriota bacterium]